MRRGAENKILTITFSIIDKLESTLYYVKLSDHLFEVNTIKAEKGMHNQIAQEETRSFYRNVSLCFQK